MAFVVTSGQLEQVQKPSSVQMGSRVRLSESFTADYAQLWKMQPQVRTVVSFLGRNIGQVKAHLYRRVSDVDRVRVTDHDVARLLNRPNPRTTRYRLMDGLVQDYGIYENAFLIKFKGKDGLTQSLVRCPPFMIEPEPGHWMWPEAYWIGGVGRGLRISADNIIHFRGYNPIDSRWGVSPLETLRQMLAEEYQAGTARQQLWANGARFPGYIKRPKGGSGSTWSKEARAQFIADWNSAYTGQGAGAGGTPILEDDMSFEASGITPHDAQYLEVRKLTRVEVAAAYHIPPPMVGILDHATFSNIKEQHQQLYQDTLGPWMTMLSEELELQLLSEYEDTDLYIEFNMQEKMKGSFEEQAGMLQTSVGGPWLTRNEARARMNLPQLDGGSELIVPLNVIIGGQASPTDSAPKALGRVLTKSDDEDDPDVDEFTRVLRKFFRRQRAVVLSALGAKADSDWWDGDRWDKELAKDLHKTALKTSTALAREAMKSLGLDPDLYDEGQTTKFLEKMTQSRAAMINATTKRALDSSLLDDDVDFTPAKVFDDAVGARSAASAQTLRTAVAGFARSEAGKQGGGGKATKTWTVTSANPRASHAAMDGETVPVDDTFSNGARWPGDWGALDADEIMGCSCDLDINRG